MYTHINIQLIYDRCEVCGGKGKIIKEKCPVCGGTRVERNNEQLTVIVEPGMKHDDPIVSLILYWYK
jgi:DnaJ-related protein SCJ1